MTSVQRSMVILVIDRLGAGYLGPYGNTWIDTPAWNSLAAQSLLFDFAVADSGELDSLYRSYWSGHHAAFRSGAGPSLPEQWQASSLHSALLTDCPVVADLPAAAYFDERLSIDHAASDQPAVEIEMTQMARIFATAIEWLETAPDPFLLWIHATGMNGHWDAPIEYRNAFAADEDPVPPTFIEPPNFDVAKGHDPDELLGITHAYAGQIALSDVCLGVMLDSCTALLDRRDALLMATSPRGYPLGEHGCVGAGGAILHGELLNIPLMLRFPNQRYGARRDASIAQPPDIAATLLHWMDGEQPTSCWGRSLLPGTNENSDHGLDRALAISETRRSFRTPAWLMVEAADHCQLYVKPDDRWEINEVSSRGREIIEAMKQHADLCQQAIEQGNRGMLATLPDLLAIEMG